MMNKLMASILLVSPLLFAGSAFACEKVDKCGEQFTYTKSNDYHDSRVDINYQDNDDAITVTQGSGYSLVSVQLDVQGDGIGGLVTYPVVSGVKFNPNPGGDIDSAKVIVEKVCRAVCADETAANYEAPVEGVSYADNKTCEYPVDLCPNIEGVQEELPTGYHLEDENCVEDEVEPTPTPTATPSATPIVTATPTATPVIEELAPTGVNPLVYLLGPLAIGIGFGIRRLIKR